MKRPPRAYRWESRKQQILRQFAVWHMNGDTGPKTMHRIAKALGLTPQTRITDMLLELTNEGQLVCTTREKTGRWTARVWQLHSDKVSLITEKYLRRRAVKFNHNGKPQGQMELWS
jgi:predicted ArsR family transcriptional regulator